MLTSSWEWVNGQKDSFPDTLTVAEVNWQSFCLAGLAAPAAAFTSAPYVINAQEPYVGALITGEQAQWLVGLLSELEPVKFPVMQIKFLSLWYMHFPNCI
jgi:hypothetical protein